jgi:endonuclease/exonuclease/phosphatase family metal-dependent hydrolase
MATLFSCNTSSNQEMIVNENISEINGFDVNRLVLQPNTSPKGVVMIDDMHDNDYSPDVGSRMVDDLEDRGYIVHFISDYPTWNEALNVANYLIISAVHTPSSFTAAEITALNSWFADGSRNLLLASRGDYSSINYSTMNDLLAGIGSTMKTQDDNLYTTDPGAYQPHYVDSANFNMSYPSLFAEVDVINFFSPSSVYDSPSSQVLINAEKETYQSNEQGSAAAVIYDDTTDDVGGENIPLVVYEEVTNGDDVDRIVVTGTTLWSDFDYGDSYARDTVFFGNLMQYFTDQTIATTGTIVINLPDDTPPDVKITYPNDGATLKGIINITMESSDAFGIAGNEIYLDDELVSTTSFYVWDTTASSDGSHTVKAVAEDPTGNEESVTFTYSVDQDYQAHANQIAKVMTYNIKESGIYPQWLDAMKEENPDIAILVETGDFDDSANKLLTEYRTLLNDYFFDELPYGGYTLDNIGTSWNGISMLSRYEIKSADKIDEVTLDDATKYSVYLPFLYAVLNMEGTDLHVFGAHLTCCDDGLADRLKEQEGILNFMDDLGDVPIIYTGDMNSHSPEDMDETETDLGLEPIEMVIDSSHAKSSTVHSFIDVFTTLNPGKDGYSYYNPAYGYSRLDYIFVNQWLHDKISSSTVGDTPSGQLGSDHFPVDVMIDFSDWIKAPSTSEEDSGLPIPIVTIILGLSFTVLLTYQRKH